jgi:hypothetical protein
MQRSLKIQQISNRDDVVLIFFISLEIQLIFNCAPLEKGLVHLVT